MQFSVVSYKLEEESIAFRSLQLSVVSWKKRYGRIQKPSAFSSQLSVISANREGRANRDAFRGQLLVASPLEEKAELPQRHGGAEKKPIQAKKTRLLELCIFIRLLPLQIVTVIEIVALSDCV